jgi:hypothetical protein
MSSQRKSSTNEIITKFQEYYKKIVKTSSQNSKLKKSKSVSHVGSVYGKSLSKSSKIHYKNPS